MTLQKRLKRVMRKSGHRVSDLARHLERPYTTVREWVLNGRDPCLPAQDRDKLDRKLDQLEAKYAEGGDLGRNFKDKGI